MTPTMAMMASRMSKTIAVAGRTHRSYAPWAGFHHSVRIYGCIGSAVSSGHCNILVE
jgi:hypothetical protein